MRTCAGALVAVLLATACTTSDPDVDRLSRDLAPAPMGAEQGAAPAVGHRLGEQDADPPLTRKALVGSWMPVTLLGREVASVGRMHGERPTVTFSRVSGALRWTAYDGCNWTNGSARLGPAETFSADPGGTTRRACLGQAADDRITHVEVIGEATGLALREERLHFLGPAGELLGEYEKVRDGRRE